MKKKFKRLLILSGALLLFVQLPFISKAQHTITGRVINATDRQPVIGVTVQVKGTQSGTLTNENGDYSLQAETGDTLIFSTIGFLERHLAVGDGELINVLLQAASEQLNQVVVVGYGTQKKSSLTSAISAIDGNEMATRPISDLSNGLGGRVSGVIFTQPSGEPGADRADILIRGRGTTGGTGPLIIVDGVPRDFTRLDPHSIASISILKDAAAVAPYGMAGANGVILVTTKSGKKGRPALSYNGYVGWQNPTVLTGFANAYQYAELFNKAGDNEGLPHRYSEDDLQKFADGTDPVGHPNHNVLEELINANSPVTNHNLELSGGSDRIDYYLSLNYLHQAGMWGPTNLSQYNWMGKIDAQATKTTKVSLSITDRVEQHNYPYISTTGGSGIFYQAFRTPPIAPLVFKGGLPGEWQGRSVYGDIHNSGYQKYRYYVLYNQISVEQQLPFIKGLSIKGVLAYDLLPAFSQAWQTPIPYYTVDTGRHPYVYYQSGNDGPAKPTYSETYNETQQFTYQGYINYAGLFGKNHITGLVVLEAVTGKSSNFNAGRVNYNVNIPELNNGSSDPADFRNGGSSDESKQRSVVYRLTYNYDDKYLFEASGRYDGNYYFAPGHRWGFFPSFSVGWRLSQEDFIKNNAPWIDNLKIRASYGESGALAGAPFQYLSSYILYGNSAVLDYTPTQGLFESSEPNPNITWERAKKSDIGIDAGFWGGLLNIDVDYFYEKRSNMLVSPQVTVPSEYGIGISQVNAGVMSNQGIEFTIASSHRFSNNLTAGISGNFTYAKNKLLQVFETGATYSNPNRRQTGRAYGTKFGYRALGYFQVSDDKNGDGIIEPEEYPVTQPWGTVHPGDLKYQDTNGDGKIDENDEVPVGYSDMPEIIYGISPNISFKGFDVSLLFQGAANRSFYISGFAAWPFNNASSVPTTALDVWAPDNPHAANPRVTTQPTANNTQYSSWWIHDGGYLRLKSGELGYTIPHHITNKFRIELIRVYMSGQNVLTWSTLKNFDPEISSSLGRFYPQQKVMAVGINVKF